MLHLNAEHCVPPCLAFRSLVPFIHSAWHCLSATAVHTINSLAADVELNELSLQPLSGRKGARAGLLDAGRSASLLLQGRSGVGEAGLALPPAGPFPTSRSSSCLLLPVVAPETSTMGRPALLPVAAALSGSGRGSSSRAASTAAQHKDKASLAEGPRRRHSIDVVISAP